LKKSGRKIRYKGIAPAGANNGQSNSWDWESFLLPAAGTLHMCCVHIVTWPVFAEQFYNEKLITQVLKFGMPVGN